jgi:heptosyltransferase-1
LPAGDFILANPLAGWGAKQWPLDYYTLLAKKLRQECGLPLVVNAPYPVRVDGAEIHISGIRGLIHATRRATAIVGVDSGPLHLAAALAKPGVAIYGPTDPARNGPYGGTFTVLRSATASTTYKRTEQPDRSMREITPEQVVEALEVVLSAANKRG